jgi:2-C-methyl-D-erythritol 4-phosphate cytidylyltransferase
VRVAAVVLAGGRGSRVQSEVNKVFLPIQDHEVLEYSLETFDRSAAVTQIVVVARKEDGPRLEAILEALAPSKSVRMIYGGATRHQSEVSGLEFLAPAIEAGLIDLVAVHDGARPFMTLDLLESCIAAAEVKGGAIPGLAPESPLYRMSAGMAIPLGADSVIRAQTPQVFAARPLLSAYRAAARAGVEGVDTAETVERFGGVGVALVPGDERNIKVTFVEDLFRAEELALSWDHGRWKA